MSKALQIQNKYGGLWRNDRCNMLSAPNSPPKLCGSPPSSFLDPIAQRALLEPLLVDKQPVEGEYWYIVVAEWLEQLKKYLGIASTRKFYTNRDSSVPGPVITRKDYAHTVDVIHEEAWKLIIQWYGLSENHKPIKLVVYSYDRIPAVEHNLNSFKMTKSNADAGDFHIARFSKLDKIGHIEWKMRELYFVTNAQKSRIWGKAEPEDSWRLLTHRDKAVGKALCMSSDFTRPILALEIAEVGQLWENSPDDAELSQNDAVGPFYERDIFEDVTSAWEIDVHDQIDGIGKEHIDKLHQSFAVFVQKAKQYIDNRETCLRQRERDVLEREEYVERRLASATDKERIASAQIEIYDSRTSELEKIYDQKEQVLQKRMADWDFKVKSQVAELETDKRQLENEREIFNNELQRMSEIRHMFDAKVKLDVGGHLYTTTTLTLSRDPNCMLAAMFSGRHDLKRDDEDGSYFIDRDGVNFRYILNFLRDGCISEGTLPSNDNVLREILVEAEYYQVSSLADYLRSLLSDIVEENNTASVESSV